ncbi:Solute carrier family 22 member 27 [Armadillidium vulgare]|nr:Solute carrier family 22 member 27 [Armadillidium vulgare]
MAKEPLKELDEELGGFGKFQKFVCAVPGCDNFSSSEDLSYQQDFLNFTTPSYTSTGSSYSSCQRYGRDNDSIDTSTCAPSNFDSKIVEDCSEFVYDTSLFQSTLVTEFELTCDRAWMQSLGGSLYMFGMPFGAVLLGYISDRFGRKKGLVLAILVLAIGELGCSFAINFYMYLALRFISGAGSIASFQNSIIPEADKCTRLKGIFSAWPGPNDYQNHVCVTQFRSGPINCRARLDMQQLFRIKEEFEF